MNSIANIYFWSGKTFSGGIIANTVCVVKVKGSIKNVETVSTSKATVLSHPPIAQGGLALP